MNHPASAPKCPVCASTHVTAATVLKQMNTNTGLHTVFVDAGGGSSGFAVMRGRTCLGCGHVMMFLSENQLSQLREKIGGLTAQPPHPQD